MKVFTFDANGGSAPAYSCNKSGDNSGEYVLAEDAAAMRSLIIDMQATLRAIDTSAMVAQTSEIRKLLSI
jgi:hypothetical protein